MQFDFTSPARHDRAVFLAADTGHEPYAHYVAKCLLESYDHAPPFDIVLAIHRPSGIAVPGVSEHVRLARITDVGLADAPTSKQIPRASYARLFVPGAVRGSYRHLVYLDTDVIPLGRIGELFDIPVTTIGAVLDPMGAARLGSTRRFLTYRKRLVPDPARYFNSGVLSIDVSAFNEALDPALIEAEISANRDLFRFHDQSYLNWKFNRTVTLLPQRFNYVPQMPMARIPFEDRPAIVHFAGLQKPWVESLLFLAQVFNDDYRRFLRAHYGRDLDPPTEFEARLAGERPKYRWRWREALSLRNRHRVMSQTESRMARRMAEDRAAGR